MDLSAMVAIHALIDNCKEFIAPIGSVLLHPLIGNKLHIFADDCHALRVELGLAPLHQMHVDDAPN